MEESVTDARDDLPHLEGSYLGERNRLRRHEGTGSYAYGM